jgi:hypothetical protein
VRLFFSGAVILCFAAAPALAFEYQGYASGMSLDDIAAVAHGQGDTLVESDVTFEGVEFDGFYTIIRPDGQELSLSLCPGGLHTIYTLLDGGFHTFVEMATNLTGRYGPPTTSTEALPPDNAQLSVSSVALVWTTPEGEELSMHLDAQGEMSPLTSFGMSAVDAVCPVTTEDGPDRTAT